MVLLILIILVYGISGGLGAITRRQSTITHNDQLMTNSQTVTFSAFPYITVN